MKFIDKQNNFNAGVITTKLLARDDLKQFGNGLGDAVNFICSKYGPIYKRVGTKFVYDLGTVADALVLIPFVLSVSESVVLEFTPGKIRFYTFNGEAFGLVADPVNPLVPYEVATSFTASQIKDISYAQSLDIVYLAIPGGTVKPKTLTRYANNNWVLADFDYKDGPYLDQNFDATKKLKVSATTTGSVTLTGTNVTFKLTDVGRHVRMNFVNITPTSVTDRWCWGVITAVPSDGSATCTIDMKEAAAVASTDTSEWRLGAWSGTTGYPTKVTVHQQRLTFAGTLTKPWVWLSNAFTYNNFSPSDYSGTVSDSNAIFYDASSEKVAEIFWIKSVKSLLIGTELNELRMYSAGAALAPGDSVISKESSYGSYNAEPMVSDDNVVFIQRLQRTVRSLSYDYNKDAYLGPELSVLAESLTVGGVNKVVYQREPNSTYWFLKKDGSLLALVYDKEQDVVAWTKVVLAGEYTIVDLAVLPSATYQQDMLVLVVDRQINGSTKRYLELLTREFLDTLELKEVTFMDCSQRFVSETPTDTITGLSYLEGETVTVTDEGAYLQEAVVEDGTITLEKEVTDAWVGLAYDAYFDTLERDFQDKQISTKMSKNKVHQMILYLIRTLGLSIKQITSGTAIDLPTFSPQSNMDTTPDLITEQVPVDVRTSWATTEDIQYKFRVISDAAMPCTVAGIIIGLDINPL